MTNYPGFRTGDIGFMPGVLPGLRGPVVYFVRRGDSLHKIAQRFNTSVQALMLANRLRNPNLIYTGQRLTIPGTGR